jgi:hypothetical protein
MAMSHVPFHRSRASQVLLARHQMSAPIASDGRAKSAASERKSASRAARTLLSGPRGGEGEDCFGLCCDEQGEGGNGIGTSFLGERGKGLE